MKFWSRDWSCAKELKCSSSAIAVICLNEVCDETARTGWRGSVDVSRTGCSATVDDAFQRRASVTAVMIVRRANKVTTRTNRTARVRTAHFIAVAVLASRTFSLGAWFLVGGHSIGTITGLLLRTVLCKSLVLA